MSLVAKPIFIIGLPIDGATHEQLITRMHDTQRVAAEAMPDYHVIIHPIQGLEMAFQAFYEKDFNEVKYQELKLTILGCLAGLYEDQPTTTTNQP